MFHGRKIRRRKKLTPRSGVLPVKLKGPQLVKKFAAFYGTRRSVVAFTSTNHLAVSLNGVRVSVTRGVRRLRIEERPPDMEGSCEYLNRYSQTADKWWPSALEGWVSC